MTPREPHHRRRRRTVYALVTAALSNAAAPLTYGGALYFDLNGPVAGAGVAAGNEYTWDASAANWSVDADGLAATSTWDPSATAVFSAGSPTASFSVGVRGGGQTADSIDVEDGSINLLRETLTLTGGQVNVGAGRSLIISSVLAGSARISKTGAGTLTLANSSNTFTGGLAVSGGGAIQFSGENILVGTLPSRTGATPAAAVADYVRLDNGTLRDTSTVASPSVLNAKKGIFLLGGGGALDIADADAANPHIYNGVIWGAGALTKTGPGMLRLGAVSTYGGATSVSQGTLRLAVSNALPAGTALSVAAGATVDLAGNGQTVAALSGAGKVTVGVGRLTVNPDSPTTWSGTLSGNGGGGLSVGGSSFLSLAAPQTYPGPTRIIGASAAPFGLRLATPGALPVGATLEFTAADPGAAPTVDLNGFNLTVVSAAASNPGVGNPTITNTDATPAVFTVANAVGTSLSVPLAGNLALTKGGTGPLVLAAPNTHTGATRVTAGTLVTSDSAQLGDASSPSNTLVLSGGTLRTDTSFTSPRPVTVEGAGGTIDTNGNSPTFSGAISGSAPLTKSGAGVLSTGPLLLSSLAVATGEVAVRPAAGTSRVSSLDVTTGRLNLTNNRAVFSSLTPGDVASLLAAGRTPAGTWTGVSGITRSSAAAHPTQSTGVAYATAGQLGVTAWDTVSNLTGPEVLTRYTYYGDLNLDGKLNGDDLARLDRALARGVNPGAAVWTDGDVNYDRVLNAADVLLIDRAYGVAAGTLSPDFLAARQGRFGAEYVATLGASVPEPAAALFGLLLTPMLRRGALANDGRRRR